MDPRVIERDVEPASAHRAVPDPQREAVRTVRGMLRAERAAEEKRARGRHALVAATSLGAMGLFLAIGRTLHSRRANRFDEWVLRALARRRRPWPWLGEMARDLTSLGGITLVSTTAITATRLFRHTPTASAQILLGTLGGVAAEVGLKAHYDRPRPSKALHLQRVTSSSFPSGHSIAAACLFLSLAFVGARRAKHPAVRMRILAAGAGAASLVGATRCYLGVHYPTDVIGGLAIGTAWASLLEAGAEYIGAAQIEQRRRELRRQLREGPRM